MRIVIRESKKRLRAEAKETTDILNMRKNINIMEPSVSKANVDFIIRVFNRKFRNNDFNDNIIKRVSNRRKGSEKSSKTTLNRIEINKGKVIF